MPTSSPSTRSGPVLLPASCRSCMFGTRAGRRATRSGSGSWLAVASPPAARAVAALAARAVVVARPPLRRGRRRAARRRPGAALARRRRKRPVRETSASASETGFVSAGPPPSRPGPKPGLAHLAFSKAVQRCCHWQFHGQPSPGAAFVTRREDVPGCPLCDECSLRRRAMSFRSRRWNPSVGTP